MEVRVGPGHVLNNAGQFAHDGANVPADSISRVYAPSLDATTATQVDTTGIITAFQFNPVPSLGISLTSNNVVISWPRQPKNFLLQWTVKVEGNSNWRFYTNQIGGNFLYNIVGIPRDSLDQRRFFRLLCSSCPDVTPSNASIAMTEIKQPRLVK